LPLPPATPRQDVPDQESNDDDRYRDSDDGDGGGGQDHRAHCLRRPYSQNRRGEAELLALLAAAARNGSWL
jgi:hypothetical protein